VQSSEEIERVADDMESRAEQIANVTYTAPTETGEALTVLDESTTNLASAGFPRVGRNEPCPCGSGKKYKQCHGKLA
jgi:preprotein translocase subunit SecA